MKRIFLKSVGSLLALGLMSTSSWAAATVVAADDAGGYSSRVLAKVVKEWKPNIQGSYSVQVRAMINEKGALTRCVPIKQSGMSVYDQAACAAVKAAQPFGRPPYELPIDVYIVFQNVSQSPQQPRPQNAAIDSMPKKEEKVQPQMPAAAPEEPSPLSEPAGTSALRPEDDPSYRSYVLQLERDVNKKFGLSKERMSKNASMQVVVNESGKISKSRITRSTGNPAFDELLQTQILNLHVQQPPSSLVNKKLYIIIRPVK